MQTQIDDKYRGLRLINLEQTQAEPEIDDPLEEMLYGVEINHELSLAENSNLSLGLRTKEAEDIARKLKHLRFYMNELSLYLELDE